MINRLRKNRKQRKGFTLIELLISIVLFTIFLGLVSQSYVSIVRAQRQANEVRKLYSDVRVFMDVLAEDIRLSSIDYNCYTVSFFDTGLDDICDSEVRSQITAGESDTLALLKKGGVERTAYKVFTDINTGEKILKVKRWFKDKPTDFAWKPVAGYEDFLPVFSEKMVVDHVSFAILPEVDPYSSEYYTDNAVQFQPKVTTFLSVRSAEVANVDFDYQFQTTISSRVYSREI